MLPTPVKNDHEDKYDPSSAFQQSLRGKATDSMKHVINIPITKHVEDSRQSKTSSLSKIGRRLYDGYEKRAAKYGGNVSAECRISYA
ncbi:hypothetical protein E1B28_001394 [Marasmius oreades]|uniref:Uncharacterized protein n=1 Tax=Marasmius oreades TaxID=181124 RepID=A0A9P7V3B0_9AGAR|nr:uncharacterized protein E1B28_001394 [Marasmius oreades]KAG7099561.1 hypothetical protein E1B28_001394 [Marasmius oreades]